MASNDEQRSATTIFTTAAQSIAARLIANKTTAKFTKAEISTTNLFNQSVTELQVLTSLDNVQQTADINTVTVINDSTVDVNIAIDQTKAPNDYQMNSVGLYAKDSDGKEVLYSVTVLKDPVYIHQDAMGSALGIDLETVVGQSSNVDLSINPAGAVTNEALKVTLADYVKTDEVKSLIPATVIDGSKPADFKEAVTLEKGAVDGEGNAIATTKNVADGDAKTLTSAKEYADMQASDKVKTSDIDPSVMVKTTLTATDDVLNLDYGSYTISGPLPKNAPDLENTGINWGVLVVHKTLSGANKTLEYRDVKGNVLINILSGKPLTWSGWHIPNENSVVKDNGDGTVSHNNGDTIETIKPADQGHTIATDGAGNVTQKANFESNDLTVGTTTKSRVVGIAIYATKGDADAACDAEVAAGDVHTIAYWLDDSTTLTEGGGLVWPV